MKQELNCVFSNVITKEMNIHLKPVDRL